MCGIFAYSGKKNAGPIIVNGLKRLEYRGYDSWGVAIIHENKIQVTKKIGPIGDFENIRNLPKSHFGIGHTRWATHGGVTQNNAHPHFSTDKSFVVAQNGIVENFQELKTSLLKKGYHFTTQTDTEVIVRLIEEELKTINNLTEAVRLAFLKLTGRNTIVVLSEKENKIIAVRHGSPLIVGLGKEELFLASDSLSFADQTQKVIFVNDLELVEYQNKHLNLFSVTNNKPLKIQTTLLSQTESQIDKQDYEYFMLKEILEQSHTLPKVVQSNKNALKPLITALEKNPHATIYTLGAGTASFAAAQIAFYLRKISKHPAFTIKSYEIESYLPIVKKGDFLITISQSGETADTIVAVEAFKKKGLKVISLVNAVGSTVTRLSDFPFFTNSGPEICVASTKAFTAQITWGLYLSFSLVKKAKEAEEQIIHYSQELEAYFTQETLFQIKQLATSLLKKEHFFVLGKGMYDYLTKESALKVKEISYKHFEGFSAGELKHGVIALIEKNTPVFVFVGDDENKADLLSCVAQVKARGARVIGIAKQNNELFSEHLNLVGTGFYASLGAVIPFQLLAYFLALAQNLNPDKPRNLAKSVTVK